MSNSIELNLKLLKKTEKDDFSLKISTPQNETIFYINRKQHSFNLSAPITRILVNDNQQQQQSDYSYQGYSFQMIPLIESSFEYGENCSQSEIIKYFRLNKQGEIYLSSQLLNSSFIPSVARSRTKSSTLLSLNMICFVNIRVLDLKNPFKQTTSKELVFIIYDIDNRSLDDLIKLKFLKKISFIKSKHLLLSKMFSDSSQSGSAFRNLYNQKFLSVVSPIYSISAESNYSDEMRKFASFAIERLNQSLTIGSGSNTSVPSSYSVFLFIFIILSISVLSILFGFRFFSKSNKSSLNSLISRLNQVSNELGPKENAIDSNEKTNDSCFKQFLKNFNLFKTSYLPTVKSSTVGRFLHTNNTQLSTVSSLSSTSSSSCGASQFRNIAEESQNNHVKIIFRF